MQNGSARRQRVPGASGRSRNDEPVAFVRRDRHAIQLHVERDDPGGFPPAEHHIVQAAETAQVFAVASHATLGHGTIGDRALAVLQSLERVIQILLRHAGHETQAAEIHAQHRLVGAREDSRGPQNGSITAQREQDIRGLHQLRFAQPRRARNGAAFLPAHHEQVHAEGMRLACEALEHFRRMRFAAIDHNPEIFHGLFFLQ